MSTLWRLYYSDKIVCDECAEDNATVETALEYGEENKTEIALNGFLVYMFPPSVIERILTEVLQKFGLTRTSKQESFVLREVYRLFTNTKKGRKTGKGKKNNELEN